MTSAFASGTGRTRQACSRPWRKGRLILSFVLVVASAATSQAGDFVNFESAHVHPIALSSDGARLYAVNTPEARVAGFGVTRRGTLRFEGDVPVGLEPVSLAVRPHTHEVWVVNHLSDSVTVLDGANLRPIATIHVGDEPTDIVFASGRAFVSLSGNEDRVAVFDAETRARIHTIDVFGDDPRAMTVSRDGRRVGLVVLESGNGTTTVHPSQFTPTLQPPPPSPPRMPWFPPLIGWQPAPSEPLIVQYDPETEGWLDELGTDWTSGVFFGGDATLPDKDLFWIDASADPPSITETVSAIGTTLFDVDVHPSTGEAWVVNTDAHNLTRFEPILRGNLVETRISRVGDRGEPVRFIDLNPHIDHSVTPGPPAEIERSLAIPVEGVFGPNGRRYYLAAFGSAKVAILDGTTGRIIDSVEVNGGPSGLSLWRARRLFVLERFSNTIATIDLRARQVIDRIGIAGPHAFDPSPPEIRDGRRFLYDGRISSGHGDIACATCHVFGNFDGLAWDLGDPQGDYISFQDTPWLTDLTTSFPGFDPMKGPMVTQTLRGLKGTEPFHWRGDREDFQHFNDAFVSLMGRDTPLTTEEIDAFTQFAMTIEYPPNPYRMLDDSLRAGISGHGDPRIGEDLFRRGPAQNAGLRCVRCHALPIGTRHQVQELGDQSMEVAHLRNVYEKVGLDRFDSTDEPTRHRKSGFGIQHNGAFPLHFFLTLSSPALQGQFLDMTAFLVSFSSGTHPCVGRQVEFTSGSTSGLPTLDVLASLAQSADCDLIASGYLDGGPRGFVYDAAGDTMVPDEEAEEALAPAALVDRLRPGEVLTFTAVPSGSGERLGIDRDRDTCLNGDERRQGTDPANPGILSPDSDGDGIRDALDLCPGVRQRDRDQPNRDGQGRPDACECGDVSDDGRVDWRDVQLLWLYLRGYVSASHVALEKCNVAGQPGNADALCDAADLTVLFQHVWARWWRAPQDLPALCLPTDPPSVPPPNVCADA